MTSAGLPDEPHIVRIAQALWEREPSGSAAVLVGAGFSRNAVPMHPSAGTMPGWNDIYGAMVDQLYPVQTAASQTSPSTQSDRDWLVRQTGATSAYLRIAEEYEAQFGRDALDKLILQHVPDGQFSPGKLHRLLVELPWADILTTNWDTLLERAGEAAEERVYDVLCTVEEIPQARAPRIIKLHGSFRAHRPFIFTEEDFRTYPERFGAFVNLAQQVAMENTLVLLGFSGDDPNFLFWSGWVRDRLGPRAPLIYLVGALNLSSSRRKMLEGRRIQPVDLARLPQFQNWPDNCRMEYAHQWFLERLRAAEPYPTQRWPRAKAGFVPRLEHVDAPIDRCAPLPAPQITGEMPAIHNLRSLVGHWQQVRSVYPGWVVPPLDTSMLLWRRIDRHLRHIVDGLRAMDEDERLDAAFEANWQVELALAPLALTIDDIIIELLDAMLGRYEDLSTEQAARFRALALAIVRHAREENDPVLFTRWADWLEPRLGGDREARSRLTYERCLQFRADVQIGELERLLDTWEAVGDSFWLLRKAGLLIDLGRIAEADDLSSQALSAIRAQTRRGTKDIVSWSRESFAMLFRSFMHDADSVQWKENESLLERLDLRQDQLRARGCPGKHDFSELRARLAQVPPPIQQRTEIRRGFDLGWTKTIQRLAGNPPHVERLVAYQALRFQEEIGLPVRIHFRDVSSGMLTDAARWLADVAPERAIDVFIHASPDSQHKHFDTLLTRTSVARTDAAVAERLIDRAVRLITAAKARLKAGAPNASRFWERRITSTLEIASRIVLRAPARAQDLLRAGLSLYDVPEPARWIARVGQRRGFIKRVLEAVPDESREAMLLALFQRPILAHAAEDTPDTRDVAADISLDRHVENRNDAWKTVVNDTIDAMSSMATRKPATMRLYRLSEAGLLDEADRQRWADLLWDPEYLEDGLPGHTDLQPVSFLSLPRPDGVDAEAAVAANILTGMPLTDAVVEDSMLSYAYKAKKFKLSGRQLIDEIARLHVFIDGYVPPLGHPGWFDEQPSNLVRNSVGMATALAWRSMEYPGAVDAIRALFALDRHLMHIEPAIPALVTLGILDCGSAVQKFRHLLGDTADIAPLLLTGFIDCVLHSNRCDSSFETAMWTEIAQSIEARQPASLTQLLGFTARIMQGHPARIPTNLDGLLSLGLRLILEETGMTSQVDAFQYDSFRARYLSAQLVTAMDHQNRGDPAMRAKWIQAIEDDPLPDTRRARDMHFYG